MKYLFFRFSIYSWLIACFIGAFPSLGQDSMPDTFGYSLPIGLLNHFVKSYPQYLVNHIEQGMLIWQDGGQMHLGQADTSSIDKLLKAPKLADMLAYAYPNFNDKLYFQQFQALNDPGRVRYMPFFTKMYGSTKTAVQEQLRPIVWLRGDKAEDTLWVTSVNGINLKVQCLADELVLLPDSCKAWLRNPGGAFNWRVIKGTDRLSPHSFGIAIDINATKGSYWRWSKEVRKPPFIIIKLFEKYGFISGCAWKHHDTFHFEYRPELLVPKVKQFHIVEVEPLAIPSLACNLENQLISIGSCFIYR